MNDIVNVLWKYCCGIEVVAFARFSCRHSWNLRWRLTGPENHRPTNTIHVLRPKLSMFSWHPSIATSVVVVRIMSMQRPCKTNTKSQVGLLQTAHYWANAGVSGRT